MLQFTTVIIIVCAWLVYCPSSNPRTIIGVTPDPFHCEEMSIKQIFKTIDEGSFNSLFAFFISMIPPKRNVSLAHE